MGRASEETERAGPLALGSISRLLSRTDGLGRRRRIETEEFGLDIGGAAAMPTYPFAGRPVRHRAPPPPAPEPARANRRRRRTERAPSVGIDAALDPHTLCSVRLLYLSSPQVVANGVPIFQVQGRIWATTKGKGSCSLLGGCSECGKNRSHILHTGAPLSGNKLILPLS